MCACGMKRDEQGDHTLASIAGYAADKGEGENTMKYGHEKEAGPDTVKPVSCELGRPGTQTRGFLQQLVTNLADAGKGELNAAAQHERLRVAIESTMVRAEADALIAASIHKECVFVRRALKEGGCDDEEEWWVGSLCVQFNLRVFLTHLRRAFSQS